ncbi:MAG: sarcosine oxidase [Candidatus Aldehydirespiratoraceae bacterium]|jgi:sarcosine oxidase
MSEFDADLAIVGLGAIGAATAYQAARRGLSVIGIDRFDPPHEFGSSHAETRVTRLAVGEGEQYLAPVARSHEIWRELEAATGEALFHQSGGVIFSPNVGGGEDGRWNDFVSETSRIAAGAGIDYERLGPAEMRERFPQFRIQDDEIAGFEPTGGVVLSERAVAVQLGEAKRLGARLLVNERVDSIDPDDTGVTLTTDARSVRARHVVVAAGPWAPTLAAPEDAALLTITRQVVYWFEVDDIDAFSVNRLPTALWPRRDISEYIAVFPIAPGMRPALKILGEQFDTETSADAVDRTVTAEETASFYEELVAPRLHGVSPDCVAANVCLYTNTASDDFLIDRDPRSDRIVHLSPCSGHGFKHSAAIGEAMAQLAADEEPCFDLAPFKRSEHAAPDR